MIIFKIEICLTISNKSRSDAENNTPPFLTKTNDLYNKLTPSYFRDLGSLSVKHYVKSLR